MRRALLAILLCTAACGYRGGTYRFLAADFPAARAQGACLDVGVGGHASSREDSPVVMYALGNRCDREVSVDLKQVRAWGTTVEGERLDLFARDPYRELGPRKLAGSWAGRAAIEYMAVERRVRPIFTQVCVDLAGVVPELGSFSHCFDPRVGGPS